MFSTNNQNINTFQPLTICSIDDFCRKTPAHSPIQRTAEVFVKILLLLRQMDNVKKYGLKEQVALLPLSPGVYQFLDKNGHLRRQSQKLAQAGQLVFHAEQGTQRQGTGTREADRCDPAHRRRYRNGRPAARKLVDQDPPAALQHPAQGRQDLSLDRRAPRTVPARTVHPHPQPRRLPIFRSLRLGNDAAQYPGVYPRGDSPANLLAQPFAGGYRQRALFGLPAIPPGQLQGTLRGSAKRRRIRRTGRYDGFDSQRRPAPRAYLS